MADIREKLQGYTFQVEYLAGKLNVLADCLSRMPTMRKLDREELELDGRTGIQKHYRVLGEE